jgi:hypothetical protein
MKAVSNLVLQADRFTRFSGGERCFIISDVPLVDAFRQAYQDSLFTDSRLASSVRRFLNSNTAQALNSVKPIDIKICIKTSIRLK